MDRKFSNLKFFDLKNFQKSWNPIIEKLLLKFNFFRFFDFSIFQDFEKKKLHFNSNFSWFFRSKISDLEIFDPRFLQEKSIFKFRVFSRSKVYLKCLIISRLNHSSGNTRGESSTKCQLWHQNHDFYIKWAQFCESIL